MSATDPKSISRRTFIAGAATMATATKVVLISPRPANAQTATSQNLQQTSSQYQNTPNNGQSCSSCTHFDGPNNACMMLQGDFGPDGWCMYYTQ